MAKLLVNVSEVRKGPIIRQAKNRTWSIYYLQRGVKGAKIVRERLGTSLSDLAEEKFNEWKRRNPTVGMRANGHTNAEPPAAEPAPEPARRAYKKKSRPAVGVLVGLLASQMNALAVTLGLLQDAIGDE